MRGWILLNAQFRESVQRLTAALALKKKDKTSTPTIKGRSRSSLPDIHLHPLLVIRHVRVPSLRLRYQPPRHRRPQNTAREENPQHVLEPHDLRPAQIVEQQRREDGPELAGGGADAVREAADARREGFGGDDEGGGVGAEVEEELRGG